MNRFEIRAFETADTDGVTSLWNRVFPDDPPRSAPARIIRRKLEVQRELFLVGHLDTRVIAAVLGGYDGHRGWIYHLAVDPADRSQGYGRAIMQRAEAELQALGCPKINLQVRADNDAVLSFYRRLGYDVEERVSLGKLLDDSA